MTAIDKNTAHQFAGAYVKSRAIASWMDIEHGIARLTAAFAQPMAPDRIIEGTMTFFDQGIEVRTYYSEGFAEWVSESIHIEDLLVVLNELNRRLWIGQDQVLARFYMNRESGDIMMISYFNYEQFALQQGAVLESFATVWPTLMAKLVAIIFSVAMGETSIEDAVNQIDQVNQTDL